MFFWGDWIWLKTSNEGKQNQKLPVQIKQPNVSKSCCTVGELILSSNIANVMHSSPSSLLDCSRISLKTARILAKCACQIRQSDPHQKKTRSRNIEAVAAPRKIIEKRHSQQSCMVTIMWLYHVFETPTNITYWLKCALLDVAVSILLGKQKNGN